MNTHVPKKVDRFRSDRLSPPATKSGEPSGSTRVHSCSRRCGLESGFRSWRAAVRGRSTRCGPAAVDEPLGSAPSRPTEPRGARTAQAGSCCPARQGRPARRALARRALSVAPMMSSSVVMSRHIHRKHRPGLHRCATTSSYQCDSSAAGSRGYRNVYAVGGARSSRAARSAAAASRREESRPPENATTHGGRSNAGAQRVPQGACRIALDLHGRRG